MFPALSFVFWRAGSLLAVSYRYRTKNMVPVPRLREVSLEVFLLSLCVVSGSELHFFCRAGLLLADSCRYFVI